MSIYVIGDWPDFKLIDFYLKLTLSSLAVFLACTIGLLFTMIVTTSLFQRRARR